MVTLHGPSLGIKPQKRLQEIGFATNLLFHDPRTNLCVRSSFFKRGGISKTFMRHRYNQNKSQMSKSPSRGHRCWSARRSYHVGWNAATLFTQSLGPECYTLITGLSVTLTSVSYWAMWSKNCIFFSSVVYFFQYAFTHSTISPVEVIYRLYIGSNRFLFRNLAARVKIHEAESCSASQDVNHLPISFWICSRATLLFKKFIPGLLLGALQTLPSSSGDSPIQEKNDLTSKSS